MDLQRQIIDEHVEATKSSLGIDDPDRAFLIYSHCLIAGKSIHGLDDVDIIDNSGDKQIDAITIESQGEDADIWFTQAKHANSFSSNALIQLGNGLRWVFNRPRADLKNLANEALRDKIYEVRSVQSAHGPSNLRIHVSFVSTGDTDNLSDEFEEELKSILNEFDNDTFQSFSLTPLGAMEVVSLSKEQEKANKSIDEEIRIKYDTNNPSLIKYQTQGLKGLVCTVSASEIARIIQADKHSVIFDRNIRHYLGGKGAVNKDILETCSKSSVSFEFWFLNNGITIVCDHFDQVADPDNPHVKIKNIQIVNGCQTATTLAKASADGTLSADTRVLIRIYETQDNNLVNKIVLTTNNQNRITTRNLRANDSVQEDMQSAFDNLGFSYERKPREFHGQTIDKNRLFTNEFVGQCFLAIVQKNPADARGRKYKLWGEHYDAVYAGTRIEPHLIAAILGRRAHDWLQASGHRKSDDLVTRMLAKRGGFHLGRVAAFLWRGDDKWQDGDKLSAQLKTVMEELDSLDLHFEKAFTKLRDLIKGDDFYSSDIDRALKSAGLNDALDKMLYTPNPGTSNAKGKT